MPLYFHVQLTRRGLVDHLDNIQCYSTIQCSSSRSHPASRSARVELHLAEFLRGVPVVFCFAVGSQMLRLLRKKSDEETRSGRVGGGAQSALLGVMETGRTQELRWALSGFAEGVKQLWWT